MFRRIAASLGCSLLALSPTWAAQVRGPGSGPITPAEPEVQSPPNLLFVVLDDIAEADMPHLATPQLDWLAQQGVSFRRAYSMPVCSPTRYCMMFGRYRNTSSGDACGSPNDITPAPSEYSLPKALKGLGYSTGLFGKWHVGPNELGPWQLTPNLHGFDAWRAGSPGNVSHCGGSNYEDWIRVDDGAVNLSNDYHTLAVRDAWMDWWMSTPEPRFAYVGFQAPHVPLHVPPSELLPPGYPTPVSQRERYEAMVTALDTVLGQLLDVVDLSNTFVFVIGDNGTPPEGMRADQVAGRVKGSTFEDGIRVPLLVAGPEVGGFESEALVHAVDVMATLVELAGSRIPRSVPRDSISFADSLFDHDARARHFVFSDWNPPPGDVQPPGGGPFRDRCLITSRYKLRRYGANEALYDLESDPLEIAPLDLDDPVLGPLLTSLRRRLDRAER